MDRGRAHAQSSSTELVHRAQSSCTEIPMSCRGLGLSDFVVASVAPSGSACPRRAAAPLPGVCEGYDGEMEDSVSEEYDAKQLQCDMASQSQGSGDEEGQQGGERAGQGGESEQEEGQGEQEDVDGVMEGRSARLKKTFPASC